MSEWNFKREPEHLTHSVYLPPSALPAPPIEEVRAPGIVRKYSTRALSKDNPAGMAQTAAQQKRLLATQQTQQQYASAPQTAAQQTAVPHTAQQRTSQPQTHASRVQSAPSAPSAQRSTTAQRPPSAQSAASGTRSTSTSRPYGPPAGNANRARTNTSTANTQQHGNVYAETQTAKPRTTQTTSANRKKSGNPGCAVIIFVLIVLANVLPRAIHGIKDWISDDNPSISFTQDVTEAPATILDEFQDPRDSGDYGSFSPDPGSTVEDFLVELDEYTQTYTPIFDDLYPGELRYQFVEDGGYIEDIEYGLQFDWAGAVNLNDPNIEWVEEDWEFEHIPTGIRFSISGYFD